MTSKQKILIGAGAVVVLGAIVTASVMTKSKPKGIEVYLAEAERRDILSSVSGTGKIEARTKVNIQSSVIGEIVALPVQEGDRVQKGDLLVQIDPERYRSEVDRLQANLRMQRIALEQAEINLEDARRTERRQRELFDGSGLVSRELLEQAELRTRRSEIDIKSLKEQITQAQANLSKARDELGKTTIRSPIDGTVTQLNAEKGEITLTGTMNNPGTVIMIVSDMSEILAEVDVDETRIARVDDGQDSRVTVDAIGDAHAYTGKVSEIAGSAVKRAGTDVQVFEVKVALDEIDPRLRPGMTAKAKIQTESLNGAITVPIQAVLLKPAKEVEKALADAKDTEDDEKKDEGKNEGDEASNGAHAAEAEADNAEPTDAEPADAEPAEAEAETKTESAEPEDAKLEGDREVVFKVVDGKAVLTPVRTGISDETGVAILEGLEEGDTVVTGPYRAIKDLKTGDAVRKKEAEGKKDDDEGESAVQVQVD